MIRKSINQVAQEEGDTNANEAQRIRDRESAVKRAWRGVAYRHGEKACTAAALAEISELPVEYVIFVCNNYGLTLTEKE